jgi:hypothetical protein
MPSWWHPLQQPNAHLACTLPCTLCTCNEFWTRLVVMMMPLTTVVTAETNHKSKNQHSPQPTKHHYKKSILLQWWVYGLGFRYQHMLKNYHPWIEAKMLLVLLLYWTPDKHTSWSLQRIFKQNTRISRWILQS